MDDSLHQQTRANQLKTTFVSNTKNTGIIMVIIGLLGILVPNLLSLTLNIFVGSMFMLAAIALVYHAKSHRHQYLSSNFLLWSKSFILAVLAFIILLHPAIVLSVLGLLIAIYFLFSGFSSMIMAVEIHSSIKWLILFNGLLTFALGGLVMASWPFGSSVIIGFIIGISFLFDGIVLLSLSRQFNNNPA